MRANPQRDLGEVKSKFESFRAERKGKREIPEDLWAEAVALLDHYPFQKVWQQLRIKPTYLKRRAGFGKGNERPTQEKASQFLTLSSSQLTEIKPQTNKKIAPASINKSMECRLVIERSDGSRLQLNLPMDWPGIEALCSSFLKG